MKLYYTLLALLVVAGMGCKKEYVDKYHLLPGDTTIVYGYTNIVSFDVSEFSKDTTLHAVIKADSIVLYWPWYRDMPDSLHPVITLPAKATVSPLSGAAIAAKDGQVYTVTSEAGSKMTYKLFIDRRQPKPVIGSAASAELMIGNEFPLSGSWIIPDTVRTKVTLVSQDGKQVYNAVMLFANTVKISFAVRSNVPPGLYSVSVVSGDYTLSNVVTQLDVQGNDFPWIFDYRQPYRSKAGGTVVLDGAYLGNTQGVEVLVDGNTLETLPVKSFRVVSDNEIEVILPDNIPQGTYTGFVVFTSPNRFDGPAAGTAGQLIITP